jgi:hypothetical protein
MLMIRLYGREWTRGELLRRVGDIAQIAEAQRATLVEGREKGVEVVRFRTGTGFEFVAVPGRALDIASAEYRGVPLAWRSGTGVVAPEFYEPEGRGWRRSFFGGLLTTCGLANVGTPCEDDGETLGHHGRISNTPATRVHTDARWEADTLVLSAQGQVRDTAPRRYDLSLTRNITARMGENRLYVSDIVENIGFTDAPFLFLYHINVGFPILDEGSELLVPAKDVRPRDEVAATGVEERLRFGGPVPGFEEQVFYHDTIPDQSRHVWAALVNRRLNDGEGLGVYVRYHKSQFPNFIEWKMTGEGTYVVGMEPANCLVEGRARERERGALQFIEAGGRRHFETEIGVLTNRAEIEAFEERLARIRSRQGAS